MQLFAKFLFRKFTQIFWRMKSANIIAKFALDFSYQFMQR
jgi:hypothetical protein